MKDLSFESACQIIKGEYPELAGDIDKFLSLFLTAGTTIGAIPIAMAVGPSLLTPAAIILTTVGTLSNIFGIKNEIFSISERILIRITEKRDKDALKLFENMKQAYTLICYTSFFEALYHDELLAPLLNKIKLTGEEKLNAVMYATKDILTSKANTQTSDTEIGWLKFPIELPQPGDTFEEQNKLLLPLYELLAKHMQNFFELETIKTQVKESGGQEKIRETLHKVPTKSLEYFQAQYYGLAMKYKEFAVWLNLQKDKNNKTQLHKTMEEYNRKLTKLIESGQSTIDIGLKHMEEVINSIPSQIEQRQIDIVLKRLEAWYTNTINKPIIDDPQQALTYPKKSEIFIPQAFQVLHYTGNERLEHESTWYNLPKRDDLSTFLLSYFNHPTSVHTPLIILGQPGSGKSLLTSMLAARMIVPTSLYTPIRVELRHVNTDASIAVQIKDQLYKDTDLERSWGELVNCLTDRPPLVLFDGYDELLQATGKTFSGYLKDIEAFQRDELARGQKPIRSIVTSRISLIDKAVIPKNATIVRLLEFNPVRQTEWISRWNAANSAYFEQASVQPFTLLKDNESISKLAEQPLLLMMLAIYDSEGNPLLSTRDFDQTLLYNELLRRFIERELKKDEKLSRSWQKDELDKAIDHEMERLGVAAISMFNRRRLYISREDLDIDLKFFDLGKNSLDTETRRYGSTGGRDLLPAEKMFGSFFFQQLTAVHKSTESLTNYKHQEKEDDIVYEFLHNTFGEFLTADFMLRKILEETAAIHYLTGEKVLKSTLSQKINQIDGLEPGWFARFMYAPLFSRPVIVNLLREWSQHRLREEQRDTQEFLTDFDTIVTSHISLLLTTSVLPSLIIKNDQRPFAELPIIGYLAIYTFNLVLLRTLFSSDGYDFDETKYKSSIDGTRIWDSLTYLWRSWFSLETLSELSAVLAAERKNTTIHLRIKEVSATTSNSNRLKLIYNVGQALADNTATGLSGFLLHDSFSMDKTELDTISKILSSESLDEPLRLNILTKQLRHLKEASLHSLDEKTFSSIEKESHYPVNFEAFTLLLAEVVRLSQRTDNQRDFLQAYKFISGPEIMEFSDEIAVEVIRLAREINYTSALEYFGSTFIRRFQKTGNNLSSELLVELGKTAYGEHLEEVLYLMKQKYIVNHNNFISIPVLVGIEMLKIAQELRDRPLLDYLVEYYMDDTSPNGKRITPEIATELLKILLDMRTSILERFIHRYLDDVLIAQHPDTRIRVTDFTLIKDLLRLVPELGSKRLISHLKQFVENILEYPSERWGNLSLELSIAVYNFAQKVSNQGIITRLNKIIFVKPLQEQQLVPVEQAIGLIKIVQEQNLLNKAIIESFYYKNITLKRCNLELITLDTLVDIRYFTQVFGDEKLAQWIDKKLRLTLDRPKKIV